MPPVDEEIDEEIEELGDVEQAKSSGDEDSGAQDQQELDDDGETGETGETDESADAEPDEVTIQIGDAKDDEDKPTPQWVRDLRKSNARKDRQLRELERELQALKQPATAEPVGEKPKLADYDYDGEKFADAIDQWHDRKRAHDAAQERKRQQEDEANAAWQRRLKAYEADKSKLKVRDYEEIESAAKDVLSITQQGVILSATLNPARVVYALGSNPKVLNDLAATSDPVEFAGKVARLENELKVVPRKRPPPPEDVVKGNVAGAATSVLRLEQLRAKALKTGDMSEYYAAKRQMAK
mgnify:FL=1|jgi:hypothetical protein